MNKTTCVQGPDVLEDEILRDSRSRVIDDAYVERAVDDAITSVRARTVDRPRPTQGSHPLLLVRISRLDDVVRTAAERAGTSRNDWGRPVHHDAAPKD